MPNLDKILDNLAGTTGAALDSRDEGHGISPAFFKPYTSFGDFACRGASIVSAPILFAGISVAMLLLAGWKLLQAVAQAIGSNFSDRWDDESSAGGKLRESGKSVNSAGFLLVVAVISPFLNFIDLIGAAIVSAKNAITPELVSSTGPALP